MITVLCYLWSLMWDVETNKDVFAFLSTVELASELLVGLPILFIWIFTMGK